MGFLIAPYAFRDGCCDRHYGENGANKTVTFRGNCYACNNPQKVTVAAADAARFQAGEPVQNCFPSLSADQREFLLSGICDTCWNEMFAEDEGEE